MSALHISSGSDVPNVVNAVIEIPMGGGEVKYELDKDTGMLAVDRFMATAMHYPTNYGYIPNTLSDDGDPADILVVTPVPLYPGTVIACRPVGQLCMTDESGIDAKLIAVPVPKLSKLYDNINSYKDLPTQLIDSIEHFFRHYKDLEEGKWVKVDGWEDVETAHREIKDSVERYELLMSMP